MTGQSQACGHLCETKPSFPGNILSLRQQITFIMTSTARHRWLLGPLVMLRALAHELRGCRNVISFGVMNGPGTGMIGVEGLAAKGVFTLDGTPTIITAPSSSATRRRSAKSIRAGWYSLNPRCLASCPTGMARRPRGWWMAAIGMMSPPCRHAVSRAD